MGNHRCEKTTKRCDKREHKEASIKEIVMIYLHTLYCRDCRSYSENSIKFSRLLKDCSLKHLSADQKLILKQQIDQELNKVSQFPK